MRCNNTETHVRSYTRRDVDLIAIVICIVELIIIRIQYTVTVRTKI